MSAVDDGNWHFNHLQLSPPGGKTGSFEDANAGGGPESSRGLPDGPHTCLSGALPTAKTLKPIENNRSWSNMLRPSKTKAGFSMDSKIRR